MSTAVEIHSPCEECGSSDAKAIYDDGHGFCFSCNHYFPPAGGRRDTVNFTYEYLPWRGVSKETMAFYDIKTKVNDSGEPVSLGFPYPSGEIKVRTFKEKNFYTVGNATPSLFGLDRFTSGTHRYVTITEGELDAASLYQVVGGPVVSVHGSSSAARDVGAARSWLNGYERIILAFDADEPGREAAQGVARLFDPNKVYEIRFDARRKDANEFLQHGESEQLKKLWWNARPYVPASIINSFSEFKTILEEQHKDGVPYPFPTLNQMTYGIRTGESVLITAQEGVGKTELMHAIEYQLLRETDDNVAAIFLEEPKRRHLQSLAGIHLQKPAHLPDSGVTDSEVYSALEEVLAKDSRLHLYSHFGSTDPESLLDTIRFLVAGRSCKYVLLDHVSMVISGGSESDERRALDQFTTRLEMMVKELDYALIMVSHVNDLNQTRSSRWISKVADVRIHATRDLDSGSSIVNLMVKDKNRFAGRTGPAGSYAFNPTTRRYTEAANDNGRPSDRAAAA
jgi:twinkle protein